MCSLSLICDCFVDVCVSQCVCIVDVWGMEGVVWLRVMFDILFDDVMCFVFGVMCVWCFVFDIDVCVCCICVCDALCRLFCVVDVVGFLCVVLCHI